jgi:hypothetical protein
MMCSVFSRLLVGGTLCLVGGALLVACAGSASRSAPPAADTTGTPDTVERDTGSRPLPPRTALVRGRVDTCSGTPAPRRCTIRVETVAAYGANTPPIAPGLREVRLRATVLDRRALTALLARDRWTMTLVRVGPRMAPSNRASQDPAWILAGVTDAP